MHWERRQRAATDTMRRKQISMSGDRTTGSSRALGTGALTPLLILLTASLLGAQPTPDYEIRVTVVDRDIDQPVPGVPVSVFEMSGGKAPFNTRSISDSYGVVTFSLPRAGRYNFSLGSKPGYDAIDSVQQVLTAVGPTADVKMQIVRLASISGTVVDAETGDPVEGATARLLTLMPEMSDPLGLFTYEPVTTDAEGRFALELPLMVPVGLRIEAEGWEQPQRYLTEFTAEDVEQTDEGYLPAYPMGGVSKATAVPLLKSSSPVIQVPLRKTTFRRVALRFDETSCAENETFVLRVGRDTEPKENVGNVPCGEDVLLLDMLPGSSYHVELTSDGEARTRRRAEADFNVGDRNFEVHLTPRRGVDLRGRLLLTEGSAPWPEKVRVSIRDQSSYTWLAAPTDEEGRFTLANVFPGRLKVWLDQLGSTHVIQEVDLNGKELPALGNTGWFDWPGDGELRITLDDQPASLNGIVRDGRNEVSHAEVIITNWPLPDSIGEEDVTTSVEVDADGGYNFQRIPAGEYRVFAVPQERLGDLLRPGALERAASRGEKLTLGRGAAVTLDLRMVDPAR